MSATYATVPVDRIVPHTRNVRRDLGDLDELAASIKAMGVLQPLTVAPLVGSDLGDWVLIAGHRRHAAAAKAGVAEVPCVVRTDLNTQAKQLQAMLVENLQRTDLTVMEEADAYQQLELLGVKEAAIAKTTGRSRATVHQRLLLASLPAERRDQYEAGKLSLDGAVKCAKLRQQYADDAEILTAIDDAGTWKFTPGTGGIDWTIDRILDSRKPQPEPDDGDTIDYAGKRAEREAEYERQRQERAERGAAYAAARDRMYDWLSGRIAVRDQVVVERLIDLALEAAVQGEIDRVLPLLGIDPPGEGEDVDDATLRISRAAKALDPFDKVLMLALVVSEATSEWAYVPEYARDMAALGYPLTADDTALLGGDDDVAA
jgi:ParB/RepB/Spo0J family partition protein